MLITAASFSAVITSINMSEGLSRSQAAVSQVENVLTCYQSENVTTGLQLLYGEDKENGWIFYIKGLEIFFDDANNYCGFDYPGSNWDANKDAAWKISCTENADGSMKFEASEIENGEVLYAIDYKKAP